MDDSGRVLLESETVERILFNPATPGIEHEPWPFAGIQIEGEPPARTRVPTQVVQRGVAEGWIKITGEKVVHRPGGSFVNPWAITHTFVHLDTVTFCTVDGDVSCKVTQNPDKWPDRKDGELGFGGDVLWFYELEREGSPVANVVFNRSKGRVTELAERVNANDPANSVFIVHPFNTTATDATLIDLDDIAAIEADALTVERIANGWNRKILDNTAGITITYDDTNDRTEVDLPDQTWTGVTADAVTT